MPDVATPGAGLGFDGQKGESVVTEPSGGVLGIAPLEFTSSALTLYLSGIADMFPAWGYSPRTRDAMLRMFWPTEQILASAVYSVVSRYSSFNWKLNGPPRTTKLYQNILAGSEFGQGWQALMVKTLIDLFTQDNGAFLEIVRTDDDPRAPVLALNHLDAGQCIRTSHRDQPVVYWDIRGRSHILNWYQVIPLAEMPAPMDRAYGAQYCALTRILRAAQIWKSYGIYRNEKISGRFQKAIHLVGGVQRRTIEDALNKAQIQQETSGTARYVEPAIIASLDPEAKVSVATLQLAGMPDGFDPEKDLKEYITTMAMAFGGDYGDFAPLPGGNLGSASQSKVMHMKSRGKGPQLFMNMISQALNFRGVLPDTVTFTYDEQDLPAELDNVQLAMERAQERQIRIASGEITKDVARQMAILSGDLTADQLQMMGQTVEDPRIEVDSLNPADIAPTSDVAPMTPADTTPAALGTSTTNMPNSNLKTSTAPSESQKI